LIEKRSVVSTFLERSWMQISRATKFKLQSCCWCC